VFPSKMYLTIYSDFLLLFILSMLFQSLNLLGRIPREIVFALSRGVYGRTRRCYGLAMRRVMHNLLQSYRNRRKRPFLFRRLWIQRLNSASREHKLPYSKFISGLHRANVDLNRRILTTLAETEPITFKYLVEESKMHGKMSNQKWRNISDL
jgi:large subunit ribosomal protein L20